MHITDHMLGSNDAVTTINICWAYFVLRRSEQKMANSNYSIYVCIYIYGGSMDVYIFRSGFSLINWNLKYVTETVGFFSGIKLNKDKSK